MRPQLVRFQRHRAGAPIAGPSAIAKFPSWQNAQGNNISIVPSPVISAMRVWIGLQPQNGVTMPLVANGGATLACRPQGGFRPVRFIVGSPQDTSGGFGVGISNIFVGVDTCLGELGTITAASFQPTGVEMAVTFPDAAPAVDVGCTVVNQTGVTASIFAQVLGDFIKGGHLAQVG
jgi:hypothetical protein